MKIDKHCLIEIILCITIILLLVLTFVNHKPKDHNDQPNPIKPDTVYVNRPYKSIPQYKFISLPSLVTFYREEEIEVDSIRVDTTGIHLYSGKISNDFSVSFLLSHKEANKLIQLTTKKNKLDITQINPEGVTYSQSYKFYPELYNYNYQDNGLTYKKKPFIQRLYFSSEVMYRPVNNLFDLNLGIGYKTRIINYEIGLNTHYYPTFQSTLGFDPYLRVRLTF